MVLHFTWRRVCALQPFDPKPNSHSLYSTRASKLQDNLSQPSLWDQTMISLVIEPGQALSTTSQWYTIYSLLLTRSRLIQACLQCSFPTTRTAMKAHFHDRCRRYDIGVMALGRNHTAVMTPSCNALSLSTHGTHTPGVECSRLHIHFIVILATDLQKSKHSSSPSSPSDLE